MLSLQSLHRTLSMFSSKFVSDVYSAFVDAWVSWNWLRIIASYCAIESGRAGIDSRSGIFRDFADLFAIETFSDKVIPVRWIE